MKSNLTKILIVTLLALFSASITACSSGTASNDDIVDGDKDSEIDGDTDGEVPDGDADADGDDAKPDGDEEGEEEIDYESIQEDIDLGVFWLENAESVLANEAFKRAFDKAPDNPQARFGYAFSEALVAFDTIFLVVQALEGQIGTGRKSGRVASYAGVDDYEDINDWFDKEFIHALGIINQRFLHAVELYGPLKESGGLSLRFERLPVHLGINEFTWMKGEIDDADVYIFDSMARLMAAVFEFLAGHQLKSDLYGVITKLSGGFQLDGGMNGIFGLLTYLLNYDESFLAFRADGGKERVSRIKELLMGGLEDIILASEAAEDEWAIDKDQNDEVFSVIEDKREKILVLNIYRLDAETGEEKMNAIEFVDAEVLAAVNQFRQHLKDGGDPIPFDNAVSLSLSSALILPLGFGLFDYIGFSLEEMLGLSYDLVSPGLLDSLLTGLLNLDAVALDMHTYFGDPVSIRQMLPVWSTDKPPFENVLYLEWECPDELLDDGAPDGSGGFLCGGEKETFVDSGHFVGSNHEIAADGQTFSSPYIDMQDPSFGGMLYVDPAKLKVDGYPDEPQFQEADQLTFNAMLGKILESVLGFAGGMGGGE